MSLWLNHHSQRLMFTMSYKGQERDENGYNNSFIVWGSLKGVLGLENRRRCIGLHCGSNANYSVHFHFLPLLYMIS
jgi:hypothetical protein